LKRENRLFRLNVPTATCTLLSDRLKQVRLLPAERPKQTPSRLDYVAALHTSLGASQQETSRLGGRPIRRDLRRFLQCEFLSPKNGRGV
jgi:hypothetical protein